MQELVPAAVYALCLLASSVCAILLIRSYSRNRSSLLLWSALCFALLAVNNLVVVIDIFAVPSVDLRIIRLVLSLSAVSVLLFGFVWKLEENME